MRQVSGTSGDSGEVSQLEPCHCQILFWARVNIENVGFKQTVQTMMFPLAPIQIQLGSQLKKCSIWNKYIFFCNSNYNLFQVHS